MSNTEPREFYAEKGLKRTSITLRPSTIEIINERAKHFSKSVKSTTQGELVDVMTQLYSTNSQFAQMVDSAIVELLNRKEIAKAGRKVGWRKEKPVEAE